MYERKRRAMDSTAKRVELVERQSAKFIEKADGTMKYLAPAKFFAPDGKQLIPEGLGYFRTAFGVRYRLLD